MSTKEERRASYVTITSGMRGYFAVLLSWDEECGCCTPWETGVGSYETAEETIPEAVSWARDEGIAFRFTGYDEHGVAVGLSAP